MSINFKKSNHQAFEPHRELTTLFPTTVFSMHYGDADWNSKKQIQKAFDLEYHPKGSNLQTLNTYVLDLPEWSSLKETIQSELDLIISDYYQNDGIKLRITQSWVNVNEDGDEHLTHYHLNSILSGVAYLQTSDDDGILFSDPKHDNLGNISILKDGRIPIVKHPVQKGDIIIFESNQRHGVERTQRKQKRVSIAFNTFVEGVLGNAEGLTELRL